MKNTDFPYPSGKELLILQMLSSTGDMYGLEMVRDSHRKLARGTVYVTLARMEERGYVKSRLEERPVDNAGPPRRLYSLTGLGATAMRAVDAARAIMMGIQPA